MQNSRLNENSSRTHTNQVKYVKYVLQTQGYGRSAFYDLPDDGKEGSREILLAFSWLLFRVKILEIILEKNRVKVGDHITICLCPHDLTYKEVTNILPFSKRDVDIRYLQWLTGKLQLCRRSLYAAHLEECAILYKIHSYTQGCHIDQTTSHLSVMETELLRQPESYNKLLQSMKSENSCLKAYLEWKHLESVYWLWMETVLQSASEDEWSTSTQNINNLYTFFSSGVCTRTNLYDIQMLNMYLDDVNDQLLELVANRKLSWHEQIKVLERELGEKELCLTIKRIKQEVKNKMEHLKCQIAQDKYIHGSFRIVFKDSKFQQAAANKDFNMRDIHATQVITVLQGTTSKMETEYEKLQDQCRKRLDDIAERLEGVVCILPAKC
ncbi:tubulin epsilon and delta complex protein 1 [Mixophyes fleayi]|uniref:tubulin epsilon and delta complex protein 1 n=1 Tax=Mixophyes fleayi TaxID=3061075 RepID=UPI003F4D920F